MPYNRDLKPPPKSFFLFGPRGTGKSTWLEHVFKPDLTIDLLQSQQFLELSVEPSLLRARVEALPKNSKVVIDEIQKLPVLLDEVHAILFSSKEGYQFALTGSSARRLKKDQANLLAGRAVQRNFFALTSHEVGPDFNFEEALKFGSLPEVLNLKKKIDKIDYLMAYVETYLKEEIQAEAAVRNLSSYHRFLKHAALMNGHVLNLNNISREAAVARSTLDGYFKIIDETLLGAFVESIHLKAKVKEVSTPKFYFFDCGVVRALRNELDENLSESKGFLLETLIYNELKAFSSYQQRYWEFNYWGTPGNNEVDFIISKGRKSIGIEVKSARRWQRGFNKGLKLLLEQKKIEKAFGIYMGNEKLKDQNITIYPIADFFRELNKNADMFF